MNETTNETFASEATAPYEPVVEVQQETIAEEPKERTHQKFGKSVGARIGICASALLVVALASGFSAFAGASMATKGDDPKSTRMEQAFDGRGSQNLGENSKGGNGMRSFDQGSTPDSNLPGSGSLGSKPSDSQGQSDQGAPNMTTPPSDSNGSSDTDAQNGNDTGRSAKSGNAQKGSAESGNAA